MSNPTSNFGWQMPTPTDLVTDLPADFEVFGQAVDSTMADLKGGTTGQILSKNSNTDMDFIWIANDQGDITGVTATSPLTGGGTSGAITVGIQSASTSQSGAVQLTDSTSSTSTTTAATPNSVKSSYDLANAAIPKSTVTAKGSIVAATGSSTPANLSVGNNGETLVADSSTSTGLRYQGSMAAGRNAVINGAFDIWQRGTSIALASFSAYCVDRWLMNFSGLNSGMTVSRQATGDTTNLPNIQYCARVQRNSGQTNTNTIQFNSPIETANSIPFAGKTVTLSFYARAGANYSSASSALSTILYTGTGTDQTALGGYTGAVLAINTSVTLTTTWQRFSATVTLASNVTEINPWFQYVPSGTAGANDYFEITGVQLEVGAVATQFTRAGGTIQGEVGATRRYTQTTQTSGFPAYLTMTPLTAFGNSYSQQMFFNTPLRSTPTATFFDGAGNAGKITVYSSAGTQTNNITPTFTYLTDNNGLIIGYRIQVSGTYAYAEIYSLTMSSEL